MNVSNVTKIGQSQINGLGDKLNKLKNYKEPIDLIYNLPLDNNEDGDIRVCLEDGNIYVWNNNTWKVNSANITLRDKTVIVSENGQKTIKTGIRFDDDGEYKTNNEFIMLSVNGLLQSSSCYELSIVNYEIFITFSEGLFADDIITIVFYSVPNSANNKSNAKNIIFSPQNNQINVDNVNDAINMLFQSLDDMQLDYETSIIEKGGTVSKLNIIPTKEEIKNGINSIGGGIPEEDLTKLADVIQMKGGIIKSDSTYMSNKINEPMQKALRLSTLTIKQIIDGILSIKTEEELKSGLIEILKLKSYEYNNDLSIKSPNSKVLTRVMELGFIVLIIENNEINLKDANYNLNTNEKIGISFTEYKGYPVLTSKINYNDTSLNISNEHVSIELS